MLTTSRNTVRPYISTNRFSVKKAFITAMAALLVLLCSAGCSTVERSNSVTSGAIGLSSQSKTSNEKLLDEQVFPKDKVVKVNITIDEASFQDMLDNAVDEQFKQASVEYNGMVFDNIAIRTKGNSSLRSIVNDQNSDRYSFKLSFDEYVNQTIGGITKINLNNNFSDSSSLREYLTYELAEQLGLPTPKYSFVQIYFNNELWGLYLAVEQIGNAYLERNFGNAYGALYKANGGNGSELSWLNTDNIDTYSGFDVKSKGTDHSKLLSMLEQLNTASDFEDSLNVTGALSYIALNIAASNMDSYQGNFKHNYYLYENKGQFTILPWDFNMSFGGFGRSNNLLIDEPTTGAVADRPLVSILLGNEQYKEQYHEILSSIINGYLASDTFDKRVDELAALIDSYVKDDPTAFFTYDQYVEGIDQLKSFNESQVTLIAAQLDGSAPSSGDGSGSGGGMGGGFGGSMGGGMNGGFGDGMGGRNGGNRPAGQMNVNPGANAENGQNRQFPPNPGANTGNDQMNENPGFPVDNNGMPAFDPANPPEGFEQFMNDRQNNGGGFNMEFPGGMGGMGGFPGRDGQQAAKNVNAEHELIIFGSAAALLIVSLLVVLFYYRRKV